jgi:multidrug resistance protein, MATE family
VGIVLQRSILVLSLLLVPVALCWYHVEFIFLHLGVSRPICVVMKHFLRIRAFSIPSEVMSQSYQKYLMSIGVTSPSLVGTFALIILVFFFNYLFVHVLHGGYTSIAWAFVIAKYLSDLSLFLVSLREKPVQLTLQPFNWRAFSDWGEFFRLGLPGCAMLCSEWWAFEILCVFASRLGSKEVAAQTIISQFSVFAFMIPLGIGVVTSSYVGQSLGSSHLRASAIALKFANTALGCLFFFEIFIICPGLYFGMKDLVTFFTTDPDVIQICVRVSHIIAIFTFADGAQGVLSGILRGAGKQSYGAAINFVSYYCLGLPLAWHLTFYTSMGVAGLMMGMALAASFQSIVYLLLIWYLPRVFSSILDSQEKQQQDLSPRSKTSGLEKQIELGEWDSAMDESSHSMIPHHHNSDSDCEVDDIESMRVVDDDRRTRTVMN